MSERREVRAFAYDCPYDREGFSPRARDAQVRDAFQVSMPPGAQIIRVTRTHLYAIIDPDIIEGPEWKLRSFVFCAIGRPWIDALHFVDFVDGRLLRQDPRTGDWNEIVLLGWEANE